MARVIAAVVTYNRRALLLECLHAVLAQTHPVERLLVIDNASTDGTEDALRDAGLLDRVEYERLPENRGGAGGFARAVEAAREAPGDWIWLMDDDSEPLPDALERLLAAPPAAEPGVVAVCSKVVYGDGVTIDANQRGHFRRRLLPLAAGEYRPGHHPALGFLSFVGCLIRSPAAARVALPRAEFFVWGDDVEYSIRLRELGEIRLVSESVVRHKRVTHSYENRRSRFWNRILPGEFWPTPLERFWQNLCGLRNYLWTKQTYEGQGPLSAAGTTVQFMVKALLYDERPLVRLPWIVRFARDGRAGRFVNVPPAEWARMARDGELRRPPLR
jgi:rhamnopyranosyl-N-acetylglucosaminyl-diphospho-decaprenol beta-1,3/1,4-galactofuranosyltransferase